MPAAHGAASDQSQRGTAPLRRVVRAIPRRILGLDPGSLRTGFGVIDCTRAGETHVASGCIRASGDDLARRLRQIHEQVSRRWSREYRPHEVADRDACSCIAIPTAR